MKLSGSVILSAAVGLVAAGTVDAFATYQFGSSTRSAGRSSVVVSSASEKVAETEMSAAPTNGADGADTKPCSLRPDFEATREVAVKQLVETLKTPSLQGPLIHFVNEYFGALSAAAESGATNPDGSAITAKEAAGQMLRTLQFGVTYGLGPNKFVFTDVAHKALRGAVSDPRYSDDDFKTRLGNDVETDFYTAGCDFFRPAMDLDNSLLLGGSNLEQALEQIRAGENVVFLANHQSEADPQVVSCLFETMGEDIGKFAADVSYVAGHKVTTDPLAIPFSMGRNLICIHSKKHIDTDPEMKPAKQRQNMSAMSSMLGMMKAGGAAIWVAPSGGRDRRDVATGKIPIAPFDQKTVDMFRLMGNKSKVHTHFYSMSMVSYDLCPPPDFIDPGVGEQRNVRFTPIGIAISDEIPNVGGAEKRHLFTECAEKEATDGYNELLTKMGMERYIP